MSNYRIVNGELRHCNDELYHKQFKYTSKKMVNGKWVYYYDESKSGQIKKKNALIGKPNVVNVNSAAQKGKRLGKLVKANTAEVDKANKMDALYKQENSLKGKAQRKYNKAVSDVNKVKDAASKAIDKAGKAVGDLFDQKTTTTSYMRVNGKTKVTTTTSVKDGVITKAANKGRDYLEKMFGKKKKKKNS